MICPSRTIRPSTASTVVGLISGWMAQISALDSGVRLPSTAASIRAVFVTLAPCTTAKRLSSSLFSSVVILFIGKKAESQYQAMATEYQNKVQAYQENVQLADAAPEKWSAAIRADKEQEIMQLQERIQRFQENAQQSLQQKRTELMNPIIEKLDAAVKKVATAGGYVYVMDKNNVLFINEAISVDLTSEVKKELGM